MPSATVIIPARLESTRFPGKVLADRTGKPLVRHVHEQAERASCVDRVIVATDDERIRAAVEAFGGTVVMTRRDHTNGTSRIAEAARSIDAEFIANVQADEPEIEPALIDLAIRNLAAHDDCVLGTVAAPFTADEDPADPDVVKVVVDAEGRALYFSRLPIPATGGDAGGASPTLKHIGLYVYRAAFLQTYASLEPTPLERAERLEQLRVLEHGYRIAVAIGTAGHHGIDTPAQYDAFVRRYKGGQAGA